MFPTLPHNDSGHNVLHPESDPVLELKRKSLNKPRRPLSWIFVIDYSFNEIIK